MVCGSVLTYQTYAIEQTCVYCQQIYATTVFCPAGHYVCETCHGAEYYGILEKLATTTTSTNPMEIAEVLMQVPILPSLGSEHHAIVAVAMLAALKNYGPVSISEYDGRTITNADIHEGIRRMKQIPSCTCANHGACGAGLGIGAVFSILLDATCAKDRERTIAMRTTNEALHAIANAGGPGCCKQSVRTAILTGRAMLKEYMRVALPLTRTTCFHVRDTSHGCKGIYCQFSK